METFSAWLAICAGNSPVNGEFPAQRPVTRSFDVFSDLRLNKPLGKQPWGWWFETQSRSLWRHRNVINTSCAGQELRGGGGMNFSSYSDDYTDMISSDPCWQMNIMYKFRLIRRYHINWMSIEISKYLSVFRMTCCIEVETRWVPFSDDIFKSVLFNAKIWILIQISLKFVPKGPHGSVSVYSYNGCLADAAATSHYRNKTKDDRHPLTFKCVNRPQWLTICPKLSVILLLHWWISDSVLQINVTWWQQFDILQRT